MAWSDTLESQETQSVGLSDGLNQWTDPLTKLIDAHFFLYYDDLAQWADALAYDLAEAGTDINVQISDDAANLSDALTALHAYLAVLSDAAENLADSVASGNALVIIASDVMNLADSLAGFLEIAASLSDDANNLSDPTPVLIADHLIAMADDMQFWIDALSYDLKIGAILASLGPDDLNNWASSVNAQLPFLASLSDDASNLADILGIFLESPYISLGMQDSLNQFADSVAGLRDILAEFSDPSANLTDQSDLKRALLAQLSDVLLANDNLTTRLNLFASYSEALENLADVISGYRAIRATLSDDAANLADFLAIGAAGDLIFTAVDSMSQTDNVVASRDMLAQLADEAVNLSDSIKPLVGILLRPAAEGMSLSDLRTIVRNLLVDLTPDDAHNLADALALATELTGGIFAALTDDANNLNDAAEVFKAYRAALSDGMSQQDAIAGLRGLLLQLAADTAANLADQFDWIFDNPAKELLLEDTMETLADVLAVWVIAKGIKFTEGAPLFSVSECEELFKMAEEPEP